MIEEFKNEDQHFAENVRRERNKRGWSQAEVARRLREVGLEQFHPTTVSRIENLDRPVRLSEAALFAGIFDTTVAKLVANHIEEVELLVESLGTMRELESRLVRAYSLYQSGRSALRSEVQEFTDWLTENPDIAEEPANGPVVRDLLASAEARIGRDAWKVLDELERSEQPKWTVEDSIGEVLHTEDGEDEDVALTVPAEWHTSGAGERDGEHQEAP